MRPPWSVRLLQTELLSLIRTVHRVADGAVVDGHTGPRVPSAAAAAAAASTAAAAVGRRRRFRREVVETDDGIVVERVSEGVDEMLEWRLSVEIGLLLLLLLLLLLQLLLKLDGLLDVGQVGGGPRSGVLLDVDGRRLHVVRRVVSDWT